MSAKEQEYVTTALQSIPKENFAPSFQKLYELIKSVLEGDYFESQYT